MLAINNIYQLLLEINQLKMVFRNTMTVPGRRESTAEHSWSACMIIIILMQELKKEFSEIDELKAVKLALIHDIVEIYAGDVLAFDIAARREKEQLEKTALEELMMLCPEFGMQLHDLWHEFEEKTSIEAKIAKAADAICPIFLRLQMRQSYQPINIALTDLERTKAPSFIFSQVFSALFAKLKKDLVAAQLIS